MKLVIYHTSDLHGYIHPTNYMVDKEQGLMKIGSYILEDQLNYDGVLKVDCGDFLQGSPFTYFLSKTKDDAAILLEGMKQIGYDAYVLGNHDFNYGLSYLEKSYKSVENQILCANIEGLPLSVKPYKVFDYDGFKIGVIGFTTSYIPNWELSEHIEGLNFLNPVDCYAKYEKELEEQCDFIIVAYHGGFECSLTDNKTPTEKLTKENQGSELLQKFDSIDLVLSGHQHRSFMCKVASRYCSQPLNNGQNFGKLIIDTETKEVSGELIRVEDLELKELNPVLCDLFNPILKDLETFLNQQVGKLNEDILIDNLFEARFHGHPYINLLQKIQLDISGADVGVLSLFDTAVGFKKSVCLKDVIINYPYPNTLKVLAVSGKQLKKALEKASSYFVLTEDREIVVNECFLKPKIQNYNYDMFYGIDYVVDLEKPIGERVVEITYRGEPLKDNQILKVVMNNYRATNTSVYDAYENCEELQDINIDVAEIIMNYFKDHPIIEIDKHQNFKFLVSKS